MSSKDNPLLTNDCMSFLIVEKYGSCTIWVETSQEHHHTNKPAYAVGNVTFFVYITTELSEYFLFYSFGDNTSATFKIQNDTLNTSHIHDYTDVCNNCSYDVSVIMLLEHHQSPVYCTKRGNPINVISE